MCMPLALLAGDQRVSEAVPIRSQADRCSRSSAEIDELYERKIPARHWAKTVTEAETHMRATIAIKGSVAV